MPTTFSEIIGPEESERKLEAVKELHESHGLLQNLDAIKNTRQYLE